MIIKVPDMMCQHCVAKIEKSLLKSGIKAEVDLQTKAVNVESEQLDAARAAIKRAGYRAE